jgi:Uma2 family endonuclease
MNAQTAAIRRPATYQDVLDAPPGMVAELLRGALHLQPRPRPKHIHAMTSLGDELVSPFGKSRGGPGGWVILIETELHLGADVVVPDLAGWRRDRLPTLPDEVGVTVAPDWVCEVLSPSTRTYDITEKREVYAEHSVGWLWFVDPMARTLEAFALRGGAWVLIAALHDDAEVRVAPFDAVGFALGVLWAD